VHVKRAIYDKIYDGKLCKMVLYAVASYHHGNRIDRRKKFYNLLDAVDSNMNPFRNQSHNQLLVLITKYIFFYFSKNN